MVEIVKATPQPPSKFLIIGEPFSGKTTIAAKAPKPLFMSTDGNAAKSGLDAVNVKTVSDIRETLTLFIENKDYKTLVIDTIEGVSDIFADETLKEFQQLGMRAEGGAPLKSLTDMAWGKGTGALNKKIDAFADALAGIKKNVIVLSYTKRQMDDVSGSIVLASELKNIRYVTRFMDAQVIAQFDGEKHSAHLIHKRDIMAGKVEYGEIEDFLTAIGWELPKKKVKVGKAQGR